MKYYVRSDCMCSTNVAFNMKTGECFNFFHRISSFEKFWSLFPQFISLRFFTLRNCMSSHTNIAFAVYHAIGSAVLMCKTD